MPTPLGNLRDITLRALDVLRDCDLLVAEDTRVAKRLLSALDLPGKEIWSYREQNAEGATAAIVERARVQTVAVVSDAGTPGISDPGRGLVAAAREAGVAIDVLPGPSAFVCALVLCGFDIARFSFEGFAPRGRAELVRAVETALNRRMTCVWYESPNRIVATLATISSVAPEIRVFVGRELTKRFQQQLLDTADRVAAALERPVRGELVVVLDASAHVEPASSEAEIERAIDRELAAGASTSEVAKSLAKRGITDRKNAYRLALLRRP